MFAGVQSALDPYGPYAAVIAEITWVLFIGGALIFVLVMALAGWALWRRPAWLAQDRAIVWGGIVFPLVALSALLVYTLARGTALDSRQPPFAQIRVVGQQWWWQVTYLGPQGEVDFITANEVHIPVGREVEVVLDTADVLHSFWVPNLAGKLDLVPGKQNRMRLAAARAGTWRGQCAEYCGGPHAQMAFFVVAEEEEAFEAWRAQQRRPARSSNDLFNARCAACHTVRGTAAAGTLGPDLTHVGSRVSIGAGILSNNTGAIAGWIASSQHIKPGNLMPSFREFSGEELRSLAAYVEALK
jgi:cytochrome c oxidase subunit 2